MKPIFIFVLCLLFNSYLYASKKITICGKIYSKDSFTVKIFEPIYGYYNQASVDINANPVIVVYVDLWASGCGPCVGSFSCNKIIDSFLVANNIERLYISLDNNQHQWHTEINKYQLGGVHVLANEFLIKNIRELLAMDDNTGIGIPHYLIYNKSGKLIFKDDASPINDEELFIELKVALNNNK